MQARRPRHATFFGAERTSSGSARRMARPPDVKRNSGGKRVSGTIHPDQRETIVGLPVEPMVPTGLSPARTAAPGSGDGPSRMTLTVRVRAVPRCCIRDTTSLSDVAALVEIDAVQAVHVGFVRKRVAIDEIEAAARNAGRDAMGVIGVLSLDPRQSDRRLFARIRPAQESASERGIARIGERQIGRHRGLTIPSRQSSVLQIAAPRVAS